MSEGAVLEIYPTTDFVDSHATAGGSKLADPPSLPVRSVMIEIAPGELIDKITILEIKSMRLSESFQLRHVQHELSLLRDARDRVIIDSEALNALTGELRRVNEALWMIEEDIRSCERSGDFGPTFIALARSVYRVNDSRAAIKRRINILLGSELIEEKSHPILNRPD